MTFSKACSTKLARNVPISNVGALLSNAFQLLSDAQHQTFLPSHSLLHHHFFLSLRSYSNNSILSKDNCLIEHPFSGALLNFSFMNPEKTSLRQYIENAEQVLRPLQHLLPEMIEAVGVEDGGAASVEVGYFYQQKNITASTTMQYIAVQMG